MKILFTLTTMSCLVTAGCSGSSGKTNFGGSSGKRTEQPRDPISKTDDAVESLELNPASMILFAGEEGSFSFVGDHHQPSDAEWKSDNEKLVTFKSPGVIKAIAGGNTKIQAKIGDETVSGAVTVVPCKADSSGRIITAVRVQGENWPNNTVDPGGADFADYYVTLKGDLLLDGYSLFSRSNQTLNVSFELDDPGSTSQAVTLAIIDCQGRIKSQHLISQKIGTHSFKIEKGDRFNVLTTAVTGSVTRKYELVKDQSAAFRLDQIK